MNSIRLSFLFHLLHSCCLFNTFVDVDGMGICCMKSAGKTLDVCLCVLCFVAVDSETAINLIVYPFGDFGPSTLLLLVAYEFRHCSPFLLGVNEQRYGVWDGDDGNAPATSIHMNVENRISFATRGFFIFDEGYGISVQSQWNKNKNPFRSYGNSDGNGKYSNVIGTLGFHDAAHQTHWLKRDERMKTEQKCKRKRKEEACDGVA